MNAFFNETVTEVQHWTDRLFSFTTTRDQGFRFRSGQFTMIGMEVEGRPLLRAYSIACGHYEESLGFFSIVVLDGPLTSRLQKLREGDSLLIGRKATGTLLLENLRPAKRLYLLATGTGLAPFVSVIKDPETYEQYESVVLAHGCRTSDELAYGGRIVEQLKCDELLGEYAAEQLKYVPTTTRDPSANRGRISDLIEAGRLGEEFGLPPLDVEEDRVMLCGSPQMLNDITLLLKERGFGEGSSSEPGEYVVEKAFAEK